MYNVSAYLESYATSQIIYIGEPELRTIYLPTFWTILKQSEKKLIFGGHFVFSTNITN